MLQVLEDLIYKYLSNISAMRFNLDKSNQDVDKIKDLLVQMQQCIEKPFEGSLLKFNSLFFNLLFLLVSKFSVPIKSANLLKRSIEMEKIKPILEYIHKNYTNDISLDNIAKVAHLQRTYFCRFFKKCMGITYIEYVNELKLSRVYSDLISTNYPVSFILEKHKFTNFKLFSRMFKQRFGTTPKQLRILRNNKLKKEIE